MRLYHFNPNNYGQQYFVMAEDKAKAHANLLEYFLKQIDGTENKHEKNTYMNELRIWQKVDPFDDKTFPGGYTLDQHNAGDVFSLEIS